MKSDYTKLRESMIDYRRQWNKTHMLIPINSHEDRDITDEFDIPESFKGTKIVAEINNNLINVITFSNIPCSVADLVLKKYRLGNYGTYYETQGIRSSWSKVKHSNMVYDITNVEINPFNKVCLDVHIKVHCLDCGCRLNQWKDVFTVGNWFNIRNIDYYKQLLEHQERSVPDNDPKNVYLEILKIIKDNKKEGDVMIDF